MTDHRLLWLSAALALGAWSGSSACADASEDECRLGSLNCPCALGTCDLGLMCTDTDTCIPAIGDGDGDGDTGPDADCGEDAPVVSGSLQTSVTDLSFDAVTAVVTHKQDVDEDEDGCINTVELTLQSGVGCTLVVKGSNIIDASRLAVSDVQFTADSQCPGFSDADEGNYSGGAGGPSASYIDLSQTSIGESNVSESCFAGSLQVVLEATLSDGAKEISFSGGTLTVDGDFPTTALDHACPADASTVCEPDPNDVACVACTKAACCDEIMQCSTDSDCTCVLSCVDQGGDTQGCLGTCGIGTPAPPLSDVLGCSIDNCPDDC